MLLPIRTNIRARQTPYANYALIAINVLIFFLTYTSQSGQDVIRPWAQQFQLVPARPHVWQFLSYAFLHGGLLHILGNMYFLYMFGNNVNDKLGHVAYICFYLAGAVFSGIGHTALNAQSHIGTLGASGAVAAVTGAYLVLFPQTLITVLYWFFFIGTIELPALYFIAIKMILIDNVIARYTPHVAYDAHLSGYAFGILAILGMLAVGLIGSSNFDLWAMLKRWNRRRQYRDAVARGGDPFSISPSVRTVRSREVPAEPETEESRETTRLRKEIGRRIAERNLSAAADLYLRIMEIDSTQLLPRQYLLDIANQLASDSKPQASARAYEQFLEHYANYEYAEQVELMLGILYSRYLGEPEKAVRHLESASTKLSDEGQRRMCEQELENLKKNRG